MKTVAVVCWVLFCTRSFAGTNQWSSPQPIEDSVLSSQQGSNGIRNASIHMDGDHKGAVMAVWDTYTSGELRFSYSSKEGTNWTVPQTFAPDNSADFLQ